MIMYQLSTGCLENFMKGQLSKLKPILQVLAVHNLTCFQKIGDESKRYRITITDGKTGCPLVILAAKFNRLVEKGDVGRYSIIRIKKFVVTPTLFKGRPRYVMLILEMDLLTPGYQVRRILGNEVVTKIEKRLHFVTI